MEQQLNVIYVVKEFLHQYPPCISQILMLNDLNVKVTVLYGNCNENSLSLLAKRGIKCIDIGNKRIKIKKLGQIYSYIRFRIVAGKKIKEQLEDNTVLWYGVSDGAIALWGKFKQFITVQNVLELYDRRRFYRKSLEKISEYSDVMIACEENRAIIMKSCWKLDKLPYVMPNKPYEHPKIRNLRGSTQELEKAIKKINGKRCIIYQGIIAADRDLCIIAEALAELNDDFVFVLIGKEFYNGVDKVKKIYKNTIYLGNFPAPFHLQITSHAMIGIANYDYSSLNNLFCAPNKIFEYAGFGIPILANDVPGLKSTVGKYNAGICADFSDVSNIVNSIHEIVKNYKMYSLGAEEMFQRTDNMEIMKCVINKLQEITKKNLL